MSGDHAKKEMETGDKPTTSHESTSSEESRNKKKEKKNSSNKGKGKEKKSSSHKSDRRGDKHKRMRKVVYYETDSSSPSTSDSDAPSVTSKRQEHKKYSKIPLHYPRISKHTPLLSVPLGKPPTFDGEDYARWSDLMRFHLISLHKSIWDVVEFGVLMVYVTQGTLRNLRNDMFIHMEGLPIRYFDTHPHGDIMS